MLIFSFMVCAFSDLFKNLFPTTASENYCSRLSSNGFVVLPSIFEPCIVLQLSSMSDVN